MSGKFQQQGYCYLGYSNNYHLSEKMFVTLQNNRRQYYRESSSIVLVSSITFPAQGQAHACTHALMQRRVLSYMVTKKEDFKLRTFWVKLFLAGYQLMLREQPWQNPTLGSFVPTVHHHMRKAANRLRGPQRRLRWIILDQLTSSPKHQWTWYHSSLPLVLCFSFVK